MTHFSSFNWHSWSAKLCSNLFETWIKLRYVKCHPDPGPHSIVFFCFFKNQNTILENQVRKYRLYSDVAAARRKHAKKVADILRTVMYSAVYMGLSVDRSEEERRRLSDLFFNRTEEQIMQQPDDYGYGLCTTWVVVKKPWKTREQCLNYKTLFYGNLATLPRISCGYGYFHPGEVGVRISHLKLCTWSELVSSYLLTCLHLPMSSQLI